MTFHTTSLFGYLILIGFHGCFSELLFLAEPESKQKVIEGESVVLACRAPPNLVVHWELKGVPLDISYRRYMSGTDLVISKVIHDQDRGPFTCVITDASAGSYLSSRPAHLDIVWLDENVKVKVIGKIPTIQGADLHLSCQVEGHETTHVQWFKNGDGLQTTGKVNTTGRELKVTNVNPLDNGVYRCVASNEADKVSSYNRVTLAVPGDAWTQIIVVPEDVLTIEGGDAKFDCVYQFADVIEWYFKQTGPLENSTRYYILPNGSLVVHDVTKRDEGLYSCVGIRGESTEIPQVYSASLKLAYLQDPDDKTLSPFGEDSLRLINEGGELEVGCIAPKGLPKPMVSWSRNSKGPILHLRRVTNNDAGNYSCIIENIAGTKTKTFQLAITNKPVINLHPSPVIVDEGGNALLRCEFSGSHKYSQVQWIKENLPVKGYRFIEKKGSLNITGVLPADQGDYVCQITTKPFPPVYSNPATLTVKENLKFSPVPMNTHLELDTVRKVHCRAQGAAPPVVKWVKEGFLDGDLPEHVTDINGTLFFNKVKEADKGKYTCIASNFQGIINTTIDIDVVVSPRFTSLPQNPTEVFEGYPLVLDCVAEGDPKPTIHWDKNSNAEIFDKTRYIVLENGSLLIEDVQATDEGKFGCTAGNSGGLRRYEVTLVVRGADGYRVSDGSSDSGSFLSKTFAITLGAAFAYMFLVVGLMAYCRYRSRRNKQANEQDVVLQAEAGNSSDRKTCNGEANHSDGNVTAHSHHSQGSSSSRTYGKLLVTRDHLSDLMVLGRGQFGDVCLARVETAEEGAPDSVVMVKALQEIRDEAVLIDFKRELDLFGRLDHPNIVKLVGLCRKQNPHYMILQYTDWGDLKQMLMASKSDRKDKPKPPELNNKTLMQLVKGLCLGMEHISNHRLVHRDLAARNCLVSSTLTVKVSLSALSKDVYRKEYFLHRNKILPIRWLPAEVVTEDDYSTKSDVFSFGVSFWEIFARGDMPHAGRSDQEVLSGLTETGGLQLEYPYQTPNTIMSLIQECRSPNPNDRPPFSTIALKINDIINQLD